jgi:hypothetical protein
MMKQKFLMILAAFALAIGNTAHANDYRVFYRVRDSHGIHGCSQVDPSRPYHYSTQAPNKAAVRRELLKEEPNAVEIVINTLHY